VAGEVEGVQYQNQPEVLILLNYSGFHSGSIFNKALQMQSSLTLVANEG
jgi:hypothetical protein